MLSRSNRFQLLDRRNLSAKLVLASDLCCSGPYMHALEVLSNEGCLCVCDLTEILAPVRMEGKPRVRRGEVRNCRRSSID